jgi:hypothetical protein
MPKQTKNILPPFEAQKKSGDFADPEITQKEGQTLDSEIFSLISESPKTLSQLLQYPRIKSHSSKEITKILEDVSNLFCYNY